MYTVLIADDEKIERDGIRCLLKRENREYHIIEAKNGKEAEQILKVNPVDILLTDVRMPYLTGFELTEKALEIQEGIQIIIFSGFQNFEYARTAIKCGVDDYILKPVDPKELSRALSKAEEKIKVRNEYMKESKHSSKYLEQYFMIRSILKNNPEVIEEAEHYVDVKEWDSFRYMIFVECGNEFFELYADEFQNDFYEKYGDSAVYLNVNMCQGIFLIKKELNDPYGMAADMLEWLKKTYHKEFFLAVSRRSATFAELADTYPRLEELMEEKFYHTQRHIFCETAKNTSDSLIGEGQILRMLEKDIREKDTCHLESHFQKVVKKYSGSRCFPSMYVKFIFSNIVKELWDSVSEYKDVPISRVIDELYRSKSVDEVVELVQKQVDDYLQYVTEDKGTNKFKVEVTKEYIDKHYGEMLNLESLAQRVYLTSGHLSRIFKKETSVNLIQYIKNVRMEKAAQMLIETDVSIHEICERAGFKNSSYFSRRFREQYGYTPENYRKRVLTNNEC